jgi:tetratricopeptide (TPR) repeat protein
VTESSSHATTDSRGAGERLGVVLLGGLLMLAGLACASGGGRFESYVDAGQYEAAISEFARDSALHEDPDVVLQVAELYGSPGTPLYDRERAISILTRWLESYPDHPARFRAELELSLLTETRRLEALIARQDSVSERLAADLAAVAVVRDTMEGRVVALSRERLVLTDSLEAQQRRIEVLIDELRRVRQELEQLKEIDVGGP